MLTPHFKELHKKQSVTAQSLEKIEDGSCVEIYSIASILILHAAAYAVVVRTSEYDLPPELLDDLVAQTVSRAADHGDAREESRRKRPRNLDDEMNDD